MTSRKGFLGISAAIVVGLALTACPPPPPVGVSYVANAPPPMRSEVVVASPGAGYVWVPGYWNWGGSDYIWVAGEWHRPPHDGATWRAPRWRHADRGWYIEHGGWR